MHSGGFMQPFGVKIDLVDGVMAEPMERNRLVYVPPHWAHRSVNTGDEPLVSFCVYPAEAGHTTTATSRPRAFRIACWCGPVPSSWRQAGEDEG